MITFDLSPMAAELNYGGLDMLPRVFVPDSA